ncbi:homoserine acetyltransferase family [Trichoderma cornu-damae]|uniref:Homoserine acetyltransferase family n=1 Tax=Trichoderma cornu-damae TaxID=654480 RepID=A0A9P8TUN0_9HYPO|nr:homoserine acetyltransferase family [Trichoderma cornu-damae]
MPGLKRPVRVIPIKGRLLIHMDCTLTLLPHQSVLGSSMLELREADGQIPQIESTIATRRATKHHDTDKLEMFGSDNDSKRQKLFTRNTKRSRHNQMFLNGIKSTLAPHRQRDLFCCQAFYWEKVHETEMGYKKNLEDFVVNFVVNFWESWALSQDPEMLLTMLHTWQAANYSDQEPYNKNFKLAMKSIKAETLVLPEKTDLYFPPEGSEYQVRNMTKGVGRCIPFPSTWGHWYVP